VEVAIFNQGYHGYSRQTIVKEGRKEEAAADEIYLARVHRVVRF
jgi:hypothetical protein